ncbi:hypothetical protein JCM11491_003642 [Sporobolomyces phaffii]
MAETQPSPALNAYGTLAGLAIASFFNLLIVLFQPTEAAIYICAQLMLGNMYTVAINVRNFMGTRSNGTNAIQKWHAEFAFLLASSTSALIVACLLSDVHFIHGFGRGVDLHEFQTQKAVAQNLKRSQTKEQSSPTTSDAPLLARSPHPLFRRANDSKWQRIRKVFVRRQGYILFGTFTLTQVYWFAVYGVIWWGDKSKFWQASCDDFIGPSSYSLLMGVSFAFASIALLSSLLLAVPVFASVSAAEFLVKLFHLDNRHSLHSDSRLRVRLRAQNYIRRGKVEWDDLQHLVHFETKAERNVKIALSLGVWAFWLASLLLIFYRALDKFLLVGQPWPYAAIQNLMFGCFPAVKFLIDPFRLCLRDRRRRKRAARARPVDPAPSARPVTPGIASTPPRIPSLRFTPLASRSRSLSGPRRSSLVTHQSSSSGSTFDDEEEGRDLEHNIVHSRTSSRQFNGTNTSGATADRRG